MSVTITLPDDLSTRLERRAAAERMSVEEFAVHVLADAAERPSGTDDWRELNARRVALIRRRFGSALTESEGQELAELQEAADRQLEELDRRMVDELDRMESAARQRLASGEMPQAL